MKPGDSVKFFWMGEWFTGTLVRWVGISLTHRESMYEVANSDIRLYHHPKHLIEPIKI